MRGRSAHLDCPKIIHKVMFDNVEIKLESLLRYASAIASFIVIQEYELFNPEQVEAALNNLEELELFTEDFLQPFMMTSLMETDLDPENPSSSWMIEGQKILLGATEEEMAKLSVVDIVVEFSDLGETKPSVEKTEECGGLVTTYSTPQVKKLIHQYALCFREGSFRKKCVKFFVWTSFQLKK